MREHDEQLEEKKGQNKTAREEEIREALLFGIPYQHYLLTAANIRVECWLTGS